MHGLFGHAKNCKPCCFGPHHFAPAVRHLSFTKNVKYDKSVCIIEVQTRICFLRSFLFLLHFRLVLFYPIRPLSDKITIIRAQQSDLMSVPISFVAPSIPSTEDEELVLTYDAQGRLQNTDKNMNVMGALQRASSRSRATAQAQTTTTTVETVVRRRKRRRQEDTDARDSDEQAAAHSRAVRRHQSARPPRVDPADLSEERLQALSKTTTLPVERAEPELPRPKQGWFDSISRPFTSGGENVPKIELNPLGEITFNFREKNLALQKDHRIRPAKIIQQVRCARQSTREAATGALWQELLNNGKIIDVPLSDDQFGLLFILRAAHGIDLSKDYSAELSLDEIARIATVVHKYDASKKVRQEVMARMPASFKSDPSYLVHEPNGARWLFVAWTFGFTESFVAHFCHLLRNTGTNAVGELVDEHKEVLTGSFPVAIVDHTKQKREQYLESLLDLAYDWSSQLSAPDLQTCFAPTRHKEHNCAALMAGSFVRGLKKIGLDAAQPDVEDIDLSISTLERHLKEIKGHQPRSDVEWNPNASSIPDVHPNCQSMAVWHWLVNRSLKDIDEVPLDFLRYLAHQYAKLRD
jgi:hypothetical protein